jgi:hypothetical protein
MDENGGATVVDQASGNNGQLQNIVLHIKKGL